jgi:hypothetical protein
MGQYDCDDTTENLQCLFELVHSLLVDAFGQVVNVNGIFRMLFER